MDALGTAVIVEDDLATQALLAAVVRRHGLTARVAGDGEAGIALLLADPPSVLIIDLVLPRISGTEVLRRMNETSPKLLPRTVVVTAASDGLLRRAASELRRVHCVMRKPIDIEELGDELLLCLKSGDGDGDGHQIPSVGSRSPKRTRE
jgi:DNA-binding response OmpR family regulator